MTDKAEAQVPRPPTRRWRADDDRLLAGIADSEFNIVYQPIIAWHPDGYWPATQIEALIRWRDSAGRQVRPERTVALAETHGLSLILTMYVLDRALLQVAACNADGLRLAVAINVLPSTLTQPNFAHTLSNIARRHRIDESRITVELSEAYPIANLDDSRSAILELQERGVHVSLDDLGVLFSTFQRARLLGVDSVKIDRSLVEAATQAREASEVIQSWIRGAHDSGMQVTAEGVSDLETFELLDELRVDSMQGFLIGRPVDGTGIRASVRAWEASSAAISTRSNRQLELTGIPA